MNQELNDPQNLPGDPGLGSDPSNELTPAPQTPAVEPAQDPVTAKLSELEQRNKELERRLRHQGNELARFKQTSETKPASEPIDPNTFFADPVRVLDTVLTSKLTEFERKQDAKDTARRQLQGIATKHGMSVEELEAIDQHIQESFRDPESYAELIAQVRTARGIPQAVNAATQTAVQTLQRNARAVTTQSGSPAPSTTGEVSMEEFKKWPREKREAYLMQGRGSTDAYETID